MAKLLRLFFQNMSDGWFWIFLAEITFFHLVFIDSRTSFYSRLLGKHELNLRSIHWSRSTSEAATKILATFTGKNLCSSLFLIVLQVFSPATWLKRVFSCEFKKLLRSPILKNIWERLPLKPVLANELSFLINYTFGSNWCRCFVKKETPKQVFSCEISKIFKNTFFYRTYPVAAADSIRFPARNVIKKALLRSQYWLDKIRKAFANWNTRLGVALFDNIALVLPLERLPRLVRTTVAMLRAFTVVLRFLLLAALPGFIHGFSLIATKVKNWKFGKVRPS